MVAYGRTRQPGPIDHVSPVFDPGIIPWAAAFWAGDPQWANPGEGAAVSSWRNGGSLGGTADQGTAANRPVWSSTALAGRPAVQFDGSNDTLSISLTGLNTTPLSVVAIGRLALPSATQVVAGLSGSGTRYLATISGAWSGRLRSAGGGVTISGGTADMQPHLLALIGKSSGTTLKLSVDGASTATSVSASAVPDLSSPQTLYIGSDAASFLPGSIGFVGVYVGDVEADAAWTKFKQTAAAHYSIQNMS